MEAKIYVGTYGQYNAGSLFGKWLDLTDYTDTEEFYEACKELHKGEHDPEFMFQDYDGILYNMPKNWIGESHISEDVFTFLERFAKDETRGEAFLSWIKNAGYNGDFWYLVNAFEEAYEGEYDSPEDYTDYIVEEMGILKNMGSLSSYFDYKAYTRDLFMCDYTYINGVVYRNL